MEYYYVVINILNGLLVGLLLGTVFIFMPTMLFLFWKGARERSVEWMYDEESEIIILVPETKQLAAPKEK